MNYRYQALNEGPGRPAFSPRVSLVLPTGSVRNSLGNGSYGLQVNLPFSKQHGNVYWHWNAGFTWLPRAEAQGPASIVLTDRADLLSPSLAGSAIYALRPMFHLMLENVLLFERSFDGIGTVAGHALHAVAGLSRRLERRRRADRHRRGDSDHVGRWRHRHRRVSVFFVRAAVPEEMTAAPCLHRSSGDQKIKKVQSLDVLIS